MADVLSGLLQGVDRGFSNGLNLYKTVQDEARQKRLEQYQLKRDAIADRRYEEWLEYRDKRDGILDKRDERDHDFLLDKFEYQKEQDAAAAVEAERRHQETLALSRLRLQATKDATKQRAATAYAKARDGLVSELKGVTKGDNGLRNLSTMLNSHVNYRVALADKLGVAMSDEDLSQVRAIPGPDGIVLGKIDEAGNMSPWDPDGDGESGVMLPARTVMTVFGGADGAEVVDSRATLSALPAQIAGDARTQATAESGAMVPQGEKLAVSLSDAHKRVAALQGEVANLEGFIKSGEYRLSEPGGPSTVQNTMPKNPIDAARRRNAVVAELKAVQQQIEKDSSELQSLAVDQQNTQSRVPAALSRAAPAVREIAGLPVEDRVQAAKNYSETYRENPSLANAYPGMNKREATERFTKDRTALADRLIGGIDFKTLRDDKGKPVAATGVEAELRSVLAGMSPELLMTLRDSTGQMEGTFQREAQRAIKSNNVQALPYMISAAGKGLDSVFVATAMQDESLAQFNADQRYAVAMRAAEIKREDPARAERLGTAGLLAEAKLKLQE